ncbi:MAG: inorganic phosphate transporter [Deltaproteobacteria bacterium]|nr:inorganic phosphate transporter [Deltaproteobacteria bacterium]
MSLGLALVAILFLAYANGANDNFKGVATLFGSGTTNYRRALGWGTVTTFAGSVSAFFLSDQLLKTFSGSGLVADALVGSPSFVTAVALGAACTVLLATLFSYPVSTTHALTGALVGAGLVMGDGVRFSVLGSKFFLPLLLSPLTAVALTVGIYPLFRWARVHLGVTQESCVCVEGEWVPVAQAGGVALAVNRVAKVGVCQKRYQGVILSVSVQDGLNVAHYLSAGAVSFARGLNDTPKIVAMLLVSRAMGASSGMMLVGGVMAIGAVLSARRVAETMSKKITPMNHGQGFTANLITGLLVVLASRFGLPVSTTHVSCGSLFGLGAVTGQMRWKVATSIVSAWVITLPVAAVLAGIFAWGWR